MHKYILKIGNNLHLSIAELISVFGADSLKAVMGGAVLLEVPENVLSPAEAQKTLDRLGSVIEIYEVINDVKDQSFKDESLYVNEFSKSLANLISEKDSKIVFGITSNLLESKLIRATLKNLKKNLKFSSRFLEQISAGSIKHNGGLNNSVFVFGIFDFKMKKTETDGNIPKQYLARMIAVQDIENYSLRDSKKPFRSAKLGMLPPKLAQIMVNLALSQNEGRQNEAEISKTGILYDPFCGTGTVLMEGMLHGLKVRGSDLNAKNIDGTLRNLEWFKEQFEIDDTVKFEAFEQNATELNGRDLKNVKWIVTEGYLGIPKQGNELSQELIEELESLGDLYFKFLKKVYENFKDDLNAFEHDLNVVLTLPVYRGNGKDAKKNFFVENLVEKCEKLGYIVEALVQKNDLGIKFKASVVYKRNDQKVYRQLYRFKLKK